MTEPRSRNSLTAILDFVGSVPFGVAVLILMIAYCWIGSAGTYPVDWFPRQSLEMTEMEWFGWWPFAVLAFALCISVSVITIREIKFSLPRLGVWLVHIGLVTLVLGSFVYFRTKLEGDMAVFRRELVVSAPGGTPAATLLQPGASGQLQAGDKVYRFQVTSIQPEYELLTGADKGKHTAAVQLMIQPWSDGQPGQPFIRQLLMGYPQYTEDVIPGKGRAIKNIGRKLVDEALQVEMRYAGTDRLFLKDTAAVQVREVGQQSWTEYGIEGLPRYHEAIPAVGAVWNMPADTDFRPRALSLDGVREEGTSGLSDLKVRAVGFLPFAQLEERVVAGGERFAPMVRLSVAVGKTRTEHTLLANDSSRSHVTLGENTFDANFVWIDDPAHVEKLLHPGVPHLIVRVPGKKIEQRIDLAAATEQPVAVGTSGYSIQVVEVYPHWSLAGGDRAGTPASMVLLKLNGPKRNLMRAVVSPDTELSQDLDEQGNRQGGIVDKEIEISAVDLSDSGLTIVGSTAGADLLLVSRGGQVLHQHVKEGGTAEFLDGALMVTIDQLSQTSHSESRPSVVPVAQRDLKQLPFYSLMQVELQEGSSPPQQLWLEYSHYNFATRQGFFPVQLRLPSGREVELIYSRRTVRLPAPVALEQFRLETYPGGMRERDYISLVRFYENGAWSEPLEVHSNHPQEHDGWWYFQATWDPPDPQTQNAGLNFTGLGVGNRHGVRMMLAGAILMIFGTIWAFYIKPVILRRIADRGAERRAQSAAPRSLQSDEPEQTDRPAVAAVRIES